MTQWYLLYLAIFPLHALADRFTGFTVLYGRFQGQTRDILSLLWRWPDYFVRRKLVLQLLSTNISRILYEVDRKIYVRYGWRLNKHSSSWKTSGSESYIESPYHCYPRVNTNDHGCRYFDIYKQIHIHTFIYIYIMISCKMVFNWKRISISAEI